MTLASGTRLGPYEILAPIGAGGMGEVYRARDKKLDRDVAIKVLPESVAADPVTLARFEREAKAVAALSHPNILSIFDFGTQDGTSYAVMELLEGETLRGKLDTGPIPQKQAVDYALQIARGLSAAHEKGVVHRDLKPENLFVTKDGHLKILDFGLAKKVEAIAPGEETSAPTGSGHTEPGTVMGTLAYMSPEQVRGLPVDHRSDIFSFGTILYELLTGKKAFKKDAASDTMAAIMRDEPPELSESGRNISLALDNVVRHCLEKDRDNRFQSARDIAFALSEASSPTVTSGVRLAAPPIRKRKVLIAAAVVVVLTVVGIFLLWRSHRGGGEAGGVKRVAVLPFENLGAAEDGYFADGMTDEVRSKLAGLSGLAVIASASASQYKTTTKSPEQIAKELGVGYLLVAKVRWQKSGQTSRIRVTPELVEVGGGGAPTARWQEAFDADLSDVFRVQEEIATKVAQSLEVVLSGKERGRVEARPTSNLVAYDAYLRAHEIAQKLSDPTTQQRAVAQFEQAVALDPGFALAWAEISLSHSAIYANGVPLPEEAEVARKAAERALELSPDLPAAHRALGTYHRAVTKDYLRAVEAYARGLRVAPDDVDLLRGSASAKQALGRWEEALVHVRRARDLDPRSSRAESALGETLLRLHRPSEAREACDRGLALAPANLSLIERKTMTYLQEGDLTGARGTMAAAPKEVEPTALVAYFAYYQDLDWVLNEAQRELLLRLTPEAFFADRAVWGIALAQASARREDHAKVREYVEEARKGFAAQLAKAPKDAQRHALLGLALAYLGRKEDAMREGEWGVALAPIHKDAQSGPYVQHQLVRIFILVGEPEKALDQLEPLLKVPYFLSPGWLKIDPNFDPLRKNPRFQKLVAGAK
jgi:TolB-like protein